MIRLKFWLPLVKSLNKTNKKKENFINWRDNSGSKIQIQTKISSNNNSKNNKIITCWMNKNIIVISNFPFLIRKCMKNHKNSNNYDDVK